MSLLARRACPICGQEAPAVLSMPYDAPRFEELLNRSPALALVKDRVYELRECRVCDLLFQTWTIVGEDAQLIYTTDRPADNPAPPERQPLHALAHCAEEVLVLRQVFAARTPRVLDYGCGWGKFASMALAFGCEVYGFEINTGFAQRCAARGIAMLAAEEIGEHRFDFINIDQVLEHVAEPRQTVQMLADSLAPGGIIKISVPGSPHLRKIIARSQGDATQVIRKECIKPLFPLIHVNLFSPRALRALGFSVGLSLFRPPFWAWLGAGQMWNLPRQLNRNLVVPFKRHFLRGTYLWLQKTP